MSLLPTGPGGVARGAKRRRGMWGAGNRTQGGPGSARRGPIVRRRLLIGWLQGAPRSGPRPSVTERRPPSSPTLAPRGPGDRPALAPRVGRGLLPPGGTVGSGGPGKGPCRRRRPKGKGAQGRTAIEEHICWVPGIRSHYQTSLERGKWLRRVKRPTARWRSHTPLQDSHWSTFPFWDWGWARTGLGTPGPDPNKHRLDLCQCSLVLTQCGRFSGSVVGWGRGFAGEEQPPGLTPSLLLILGIPALWKEPCVLKEFPSWAPASLLLYCQNPAPPMPLFVPTLGLSLPVDSLLPLSAGHRSLRPGSGGLGGQLGVPLGTENFLFLLGSGR